jgi:hypothetical protein
MPILIAHSRTCVKGIIPHFRARLFVFNGLRDNFPPPRAFWIWAYAMIPSPRLRREAG